jgi:hypothetical protein
MQEIAECLNRTEVRWPNLLFILTCEREKKHSEVGG